MTHDLPDLPDFHIDLKHDSADAGGHALLRGRLAANLLADPGPLEVAITDAEGNELARGRFIDQEDGWHRTALMQVPVPAQPGLHQFVGFLQDLEDGLPPPGPEDAAVEPEIYATHAFSVTATGPSTQIVVWDVPPAVECGAEITFRVGLRSSGGHSSAGWPFTVLGEDGAVLAEGQVGEEAWPGTEGLCHARVTLPAASAAGLVALTVRAQGAEAPLPHAPREETVRIRIAEPARHRIRIQAFDAETGEPVARAKLVAHPYRTQAGPDGRAELVVAPGRYTIFVSGTKYFAFQETRDVTGDVDLRVELHHDKVLSHEDIWS